MAIRKKKIGENAIMNSLNKENDMSLLGYDVFGNFFYNFLSKNNACKLL